LSRGLVRPADPESVALAVEIMLRGGVIAFATETLYGLGGSGLSEAAVARVFRIKGRGRERPLPLIVADLEAAAAAAELDPLGRRLARRFWPGPLTLILKARRAFPAGVAREGKIALRVSSHPLAGELAGRLAAPLIATSANLTGQPAPLEAGAAALALAHDPPDLILDAGPSPGGAGSTILDLTVRPPLIVRPGAVAPEELKDCLG